MKDPRQYIVCYRVSVRPNRPIAGVTVQCSVCDVDLWLSMLHSLEVYTPVCIRCIGNLSNVLSKSEVS